MRAAFASPASADASSDSPHPRLRMTVPIPRPPSFRPPKRCTRYGCTRTHMRPLIHNHARTRTRTHTHTRAHTHTHSRSHSHTHAPITPTSRIRTPCRIQPQGLRMRPHLLHPAPLSTLP